MTTLFIGKDKGKLEDPIYKQFVEDKRVDLEMKGIILVPGKIMAGVCFPATPIENEYPHMTLLLG